MESLSRSAIAAPAAAALQAAGCPVVVLGGLLCHCWVSGEGQQLGECCAGKVAVHTQVGGQAGQGS